jgi:phage terminase large subunit
MSATPTPEQARALLWARGEVAWKLDSNQKVCYDMYKNSKEKIIVWSLARGNGKSFLLCVAAIEECLKNPKALIKYCCPKQKDARQIIQPLFRDILEDCPLNLRPEYNVSEGAYKFKNGAQIQISGLDNGRAESLRGGSCVLAIVDEAGSKSLKDLQYIIRSILIPTVTRKKSVNGKIILASTPPTALSHPFVKFMKDAELRDSLVVRTIYSNPRMTPEMIEALIESCGGKDSADFRREYMAEVVQDDNISVFPEFNDSIRAQVIKPWERPSFFDIYTSMDLGVRDFTVVLFAYFDFRENKIIIEDEFVLQGNKMTTDVLARGIKQKEEELFKDVITGEVRVPILRVSDNNLIVINDLYQLHGLSFTPTRKDDKFAAVNNARMMLKAGRIIIHPRCTITIRHLRDASWNRNRDSYERGADGSHYDAVDALVYLLRNINFQRNPYPSNYGFHKGDNYIKYKKTDTNLNANILKRMFNMKR